MDAKFASILAELKNRLVSNELGIIAILTPSQGLPKYATME
jgi:hypothetical protein